MPGVVVIAGHLASPMWMKLVHPALQERQRPRVESEVIGAPMLATADQASVFQNPDVLMNGRKRQPPHVRELVDCERLQSQQVNDFASMWVGQCFQQLVQQIVWAARHRTPSLA